MGLIRQFINLAQILNNNKLNVSNRISLENVLV